MKTRKKTAFLFCAELPTKTVTLTVPGQFSALRDNRGFTLVELLMVSAVLAVLVAIAIPMWPRYKNLARSSRAMSEIKMLETSISAHIADRGVRPANLNDIGYGELLDPWGHPYKYEAAGRTFVGPINSDYDLYSEGADGTHVQSIIDSPDDIIRATDGSFLGMAAKFGT